MSPSGSKFTPSSRRGITHQYNRRLAAFEYTPEISESPQNLLIFIGGLYDGLNTVPYPRKIVDALPSADWSVAEVLLSSSYTGWGKASLVSDATELAECVAYFRAIKRGSIVLMGHSTGCQDVMEYLTGPGCRDRLAAAPIDAGIIQAPCSDREALVMLIEPSIYEDGCRVAQKLVDAENPEEILPLKITEGFGPAPVSARRWLSLASPTHTGEDDYFSSDLPDERFEKTFGTLPATAPLCVLFSGSDEFVPKFVDKEALLQKFIAIAKKGTGSINEEFSGIVPNATHNLAGNPDEVVAELVRRVVGFLKTLPLKV